MKINILMATYNGEAFLAEQLKSIQDQTISNWQLWIRDDGSTDGTVAIIRHFAKSDYRIRLINEGETKNLGVIQSFYQLVKHESADVYFFSDQDDIWLPEKLEVTLKQAEREAVDQPLLVYTDLAVVDEQLNVLQKSMIRTQSHHANTTLLQELTENTVTGGTAMINHALALHWTTTENLMMHDWYLALVASALGKLVYVDQVTELYRQHASNVLGARTWSKRMKGWIRPHRLIAKYWGLIRGSQQQAEHLFDLPLSAENRKLVEAYLTVMEKPLIGRIRTLCQYRFGKNRPFHTLVFTILILTKLGYRRKS